MFNFMASQDTQLSKFEVDFKQQQSEMANKIDTFLKAIKDRMMGALPSDTVKNPKFNVNSTSLVSSARSYPMEDPQILRVLAHAPMYNAFLDKYVESLELGKNGSTFIQSEMPQKMKDPGLFILPWLADGTKSYPVEIIRNVEVYVGKLKPLEDFYVIDMEKDPTRPLLVGRGFLATASAVIDCKKSKIAAKEGITRLIFGVKEIGLGHKDMPYWITIVRRKSYYPRPNTNDIGARPPYYLEKDFMENHVPGEWEIARDAKLNPFKDVLVFGGIPRSHTD
ncbi:hypothetical protein Tco_0852775 [Tanacetum coccineum]